MKFIAIIPARYASTRFPAKPLAVLGGKPVDSRKRQLMTLYGGRAWTAMSAELFPSLRSARIRAVYDRTRLCDLPMWKRSETSFRRASETVNEMRGGVMGLDSLVGRTEVPDSVRAVMTQVVEVLRNSVAVSYTHLRAHET